MTEDNRRFARMFGDAIDVRVDQNNTYVRTPNGYVVADTPYACKLTNSQTIGEVFSALSMLAEKNKQYNSQYLNSEQT